MELQKQNEGNIVAADDSSIQLIRKLENPYSVANMKLALKNLKSKKSIGADELEIVPTHLYIKFIPKTEDEVMVLRSDSTLDLYEYPLDYELSDEGNKYRAPDLPDGQPTYHYCAVPVDKELTDVVEYQVLEQLYIPDEDMDEAIGKKNNVDQATIDNLVYEALRITNNLEKGITKKFWSRSKKWRPEGKITVKDSLLGDIGVEGAEVKARRWFTTHTGLTRRDGSFSCDGRFRGEARYTLDWERHHFALRSGGFSSAEKRGPETKKRWEWHIEKAKEKEQQYFATVFRAAYHYYYKNIKGLRRPKQNTFSNSKLRIGAWTQNKPYNGIHQSTPHFAGLSTGIKIYMYGERDDRAYATTIHELAHSSHYEMDRGKFGDTQLIVKESWARGVQRELTRMVYPNYILTDLYSRVGYTGIVEDMIDGFSITTSRWYYEDEDNPWIYTIRTYNDRVSNYTIKQIEDALNGQKHWNGWRDNIKIRYNNATENNLDAAFTYWNTK